MRDRKNQAASPRHGLARALSKRGVCSRTQGALWVREGRVRVNGRIERDPEFPTTIMDQIVVDELRIEVQKRQVLMMNKPRGFITTRADEQGRKTVYDLMPEALPWLAPIGRLDQASEGLLLFTNDPEFAAKITAPESKIEKIYHVQLDRLPSDELLGQWQNGIIDRDEVLHLPRVRVLRAGTRNAWVEVVLQEGRNRHIRRVMAASGIGVLRLMRVAIANLVLGDLVKAQTRWLDETEMFALEQSIS